MPPTLNLSTLKHVNYGKLQSRQNLSTCDALFVIEHHRRVTTTVSLDSLKIGVDDPNQFDTHDEILVNLFRRLFNFVRWWLDWGQTRDSGLAIELLCVFSHFRPTSLLLRAEQAANLRVQRIDNRHRHLMFRPTAKVARAVGHKAHKRGFGNPRLWFRQSP